MLLRNMFLKFLLVKVVLLVPAVFTLAYSQTQVRLSQVYVDLPRVKAYIEVLDETNVVVDSLGTDQVTASVGTTPAKTLSVTPFRESGEGVAYIFLIDVSKSLRSAQFVVLQKALAAAIDAMGEKDRAAIVTFGTEVKIVQSFTGSQSTLTGAIAEITTTDNDTQLHRGLIRASELGKVKAQDIPNRRVILILSDGMDDFAGGMTKEEVLDKLAENHIPVYAIGLDQSPNTRIQEESLKVLGEFARTSGGDYIEVGTQPIDEVYKDLLDKIWRTYLAEFSCEEVEADGQVKRVQVSISMDDHSVSSGLDIRFLPKAPVPETGWSNQQKTAMAAVAAVVALILILTVRSRTRQRRADSEKEASSTPNRPASVPPAPTRMVKKAKLRKLTFTVVKGTEPGHNKDLEMTDELVIGRSQSCDYKVEGDDEVSSRHCQISLAEDDLMIGDLNSTNGTSVNGAPLVQFRTLEDGDIVGLGRTEIRISFRD